MRIKSETVKCWIVPMCRDKLLNSQKSLANCLDSHLNDENYVLEPALWISAFNQGGGQWPHFGNFSEYMSELPGKYQWYTVTIFVF